MKLVKKLSVLFIAAALAAAPVAGTFALPTEIVEAKAVKISAKELALNVGESAKLKVKGAKKVKWASDNKEVATVNKKGKVTAVAEGVANITAKAGKKKLTCVVTVTDPNAGAPDYAKEACWYNGIPEITKEVDSFFIYGTRYNSTSMEEGAPDYASLDNPEMIRTMPIEYMKKTSVFEEATNVFVPYYRQAGMRFERDVWKADGNIDAAVSGMPYDDITAALDYYFENYNEGRPFILAGHSQGSAILKLVLKGYFKEHPEYYERMIAAYVVGFSVTKDDLEANPHLKFATGETDTGVIISWNTEGKKNVEEKVPTAVLLPNAISINPLNWKLDDTYAPVSENLGSYMVNPETNELELMDVGADAQVDPERGVVVTNANVAPIAMPELFGPESFHSDDYTLFYSNIKDNVAKRIAAYFQSSPRNQYAAQGVHEVLGRQGVCVEGAIIIG